MIANALTKLACFALLLNDGVFAKKYKKVNYRFKISKNSLRSQSTLKTSIYMRIKPQKATDLCEISVSSIIELLHNSTLLSIKFWRLSSSRLPFGLAFV